MPACEDFRFAIKRSKADFAVFSLQGGGDEHIGKIGIFRQERAVSVGAKSAFITHALGFIRAVIAEAFNYFAERLGRGAEVSAPRMIFKADEANFFLGFKFVISDEALFPAHRVKIKYSRKIQARASAVS